MKEFIKRKINKSNLVKKIAKKTLKKVGYRSIGIGGDNYQDWIKQNEKHLFIKDIPSSGPLISIIVPCYNTPKKYIYPLIESVLSQKYQNWELCLADGSTNIESSNLIKGLSKKDSRIKYISINQNKGIAGNTNEGIKNALGIYLGFLDHDDTLSPYALSEVVSVINNDPSLDLIYSDEDKLSENGKTRLLPFFKPNWSPEMLLGVNYITHFVIARTKLVKKIGGIRDGFDGAQDYDFLLRFTENTDKIYHIPKILYHWRLADGSTSGNVQEKNYADSAGQKALKDAVKRRKIKADVIEITDRPTNYRLSYKLPSEPPLVSIIIPFKDKVELLKVCVGSILEKTKYKNYEIILLSNNSEEKNTHEYLELINKNKKCNVYEWNKQFNYSKINNFGRQKAKGKYLVFLNNDTEIITATWLEELVGVASQKSIGGVGPLLRYPDKSIQHAGVVLGLTGMAGHVFRKLSPYDWTPYGMACWPRNYMAVTGACLVIKAETYDKAGGLDEEFIVAGNDVALGIRLNELGYRNVLWPFAEVYHHENVSVGSYSNVPESDFKVSMRYYNKYLNWNDGYFNLNLDLMNEQIGIRRDYAKTYK